MAGLGELDPLLGGRVYGVEPLLGEDSSATGLVPALDQIDRNLQLRCLDAEVVVLELRVERGMVSTVPARTRIFCTRSYSAT